MKLMRHEQLAVILILLSIVFLFLSYCSNNAFKDIFQGVATGLISGVILFAVTGVKNSEHRELDLKNKTVNNCRTILYEIVSAYNDLYHATYHHKKDNMVDEKYSNIVMSAACKCWFVVGRIKECAEDLNSFQDEPLLKDIRSRILSIESDVRTLEECVEMKGNSFPRTFLENLEFKIRNIGGRAWELDFICQSVERDIDKQKARINSSLI